MSERPDAVPVHTLLMALEKLGRKGFRSFRQVVFHVACMLDSVIPSSQTTDQ